VAFDVGPLGIQCNDVVPDSIDTDLVRNRLERIGDESSTTYEQQRERKLSGVLLRTISSRKRWCKRRCSSPATRDGGTMTGQSVNCDAGAVIVG
jgi:hypothetical protein